VTADPRPTVGLLGPTPAAARRFVARLQRRLPGFLLVPLSLARFLSDRGAPSRVVVCPAGASLAGDLAFLDAARRRALWPPPGVDLWGAIAGLRGSHDEPPRGARAPRPGRVGRASALLLEGDVTSSIARRAAASGAPRLWIVERVQRVRVPETVLAGLRRQGIRWSVLEPVEVLGLAATPELLAARHRWVRLLPPNVTVWPLTSRPETRVTRPE
jgi:hypothetical protein